MKELGVDWDEKEYITCIGCLGVGVFKTHNGVIDCRDCKGKGKIPKYKVGDEINYCLNNPPCDCLGGCNNKIKLKFISENPKNADEWIAIMVG